MAAQTQSIKNKIYICNLPFTTTEEDLKELFSKCGKVKEASIPTDETNRHLGFGFVEFENEESAEKAIKEMNGKEVNGRQLHVDIAKKACQSRGRW